MVQSKKPKRALVALNVRLEPAVKIALDKAAKADTRTTSSLVQKIITDHLRAGGFLK